ncbi:MAG: alpha/beta hydrolase [Burkholderiales bacterium]
MPKTRVALVIVAFAVAFSGLAGCASPPAKLTRTAPTDLIELARDDLMVKSNDPGIALQVRNKRPSSMVQFSPERTVLFVHGATYPAHTSFDLQLGGLSWMDFIASRGFDVWLVNVRGYGLSTRPPQMAQPADANEPVVRGDVAVRDIGTVVDHILAKRGIAKLNLIGWSWGTTLMGAYATQNPTKVHRLALYAPSYLRETASLVQVQGKLGAYRTVRRDQALGRWLTGVPENKKASLIPGGWFDAWADATWATDPEFSKLTPSLLRAPNGILQDSSEFWGATTQPPRPYWDPEKIVVPTLLVLGEWDRDTPQYMAQNLLPKLVHAPWKRLVVLSEGTHTIMMEKNRMDLFNTVQQFLEE